jgi:hypothetical protein
MDEQEVTQQTIPDGIASPEKNIQIQLFSGIFIPVGAGAPIMREGFITQTGLMHNCSPIKQL